MTHYKTSNTKKNPNIFHKHFKNKRKYWESLSLEFMRIWQMQGKEGVNGSLVGGQLNNKEKREESQMNGKNVI